MSSGALLALARLLPAPAAAHARGTRTGAISVRLPLASAAFRRTGVWFTSLPVTAPRPFDVLGLHWRGRWSAWVRAPSISR
jgi:hypothetical protein